MFDDRFSTNSGAQNCQPATRLQTSQLPTLKRQTSEEIDNAVATFKASDCQGEELITLWQRIREAALVQFAEDPRLDTVAGMDSY